MSSLRTGYIYHELFGWHDTGTQAGMFPSDPTRGLQPFINYENSETKRRIHELIVVSGLIDHLDRRTPPACHQRRITLGSSTELSHAVKENK